MPPWKWGSSTTSPTGTVLSPQGPSPGKEEKETDFCRASAFLFRVSFQRRWQVSAFLHLLNWKEAIENSFDFQWQLMLSGYWRAKQTNRKHPQTKMSFLSCYFFFIPFFWKSNACVRALEMWTPDLQTFRHVSPYAIYPWLGKTASVKRSWCSAGALQDRGVVGAETGFSKPISKHSPLAMNPRETMGRAMRQHQKRLPKQQPCQQSSSTLNLKYHRYTILSDFLLIAFYFILFYPIWKYSQTPELFLNSMLVKPNRIVFWP